MPFLLVVLFTSLGFGTEYNATSLAEGEELLKGSIQEAGKSISFDSDLAPLNDYKKHLKSQVGSVFCKDQEIGLNENLCKSHLQQLLKSLVRCDLPGVIKAFDSACNQGKITGVCDGTNSQAFEQLCKIGRKKAPKNANWRKKKLSRSTKKHTPFRKVIIPHPVRKQSGAKSKY